MSGVESTRCGKGIAEEETSEPKNVIIPDEDHNANKDQEVLPSSNAGSSFKASSANIEDGQNPEFPVYHCKHCGRTFATPRALGGHQISHLRRSTQTMDSNNLACFGCPRYPYQNPYAIHPSSIVASHGSHLIRSLGVQMNSTIHEPNYNPWYVGGSQYWHGGSSITLGHFNMGQYQAMHTGDTSLTLGHSNMAQYQTMHTNPQIQGLTAIGGDSLSVGNNDLSGRTEGPNPPMSPGAKAFPPYTFGGTSSYANHDGVLDLQLGNNVDAYAPMLMGSSPANVPNHGDNHIVSNSDYSTRNNARPDAHLKKLEEELEKKIDLTLKL